MSFWGPDVEGHVLSSCSLTQPKSQNTWIDHWLPAWTTQHVWLFHIACGFLFPQGLSLSLSLSLFLAPELCFHRCSLSAPVSSSGTEQGTPCYFSWYCTLVSPSHRAEEYKAFSCNLLLWLNLDLVSAAGNTHIAPKACDLRGLVMKHTSFGNTGKKKKFNGWCMYFFTVKIRMIIEVLSDVCFFMHIILTKPCTCSLFVSLICCCLFRV